MSNQGKLPKLSRSQVLEDITREYLRDTGISELSFSKLVFLNYLSLVPEWQRSFTIKPWAGLDHAAADKVIETNYKRFSRHINREQPTPLDLEEAWVEALGEGYRQRAIVQLCGRYQVAAVELHHQMNCAGVAEHMKRSGDFMETMASILDDGEIDARDLQHLPDVRQSARRLVSSIIGMINSVEISLGVPHDESFIKHLGQLDAPGGDKKANQDKH